MAFAARARVLHALTAATLFSLATLARSAAADTVVQVPVDSLIDGRSVSTLSGTTIVPWSAAQGVDGDGYADGFVTAAVEALLQTQNKTEGGKLGVALPNDGTFAETTRHPEIVLHFSDTAANTSPQTHQVHISQGPQSFQFNVPPATYSKMYLMITCSEGAAALTITLSYAGGAAPTVSTLMLPDYGIGGAAANDPVFFNLISGMDKWSSTNQEGDGPSHTITGIELTPSAGDMLTSIQVAKTNGSHVVFWGATGIATSAVTVGSGGSGGAAGAAGASGAGGGGGAATAGGVGGSNSSGGATPSAGAAGTGGAAGATPSGQAGATSSGSAGSASSVPDTSDSSDSGGCSFTNRTATPIRGLAVWAALLGACGVLRRRRRRAA